MSVSPSPSTTFFAPAKINLFLHLTGKRNDGYHNLQSLVSFADIGDYITLSHSKAPEFSVEGPFATGFSEAEKDSGPQSKNIIIQALWGLSRLYKKPPEFHVHLKKNLPIAAGIGGGSADAAALIWGVVKQWGKPTDQDEFQKFMLELGADVPVCYQCDNTFVEGIGESISPVNHFPEIPIVLINPLKPCPTGAVFKSFSGNFSRPIQMPDNLSLDALIDFIAQQRNDLEKPACAVIEDITNILNALNFTDGCRLARMSGSGATCFALFDSVAHSENAAAMIKQENPDWWVKSGIIGGAARY